MKISKADEGILVIALTDKIQNTSIKYYGYAPVGIGWEDSIFQSLDTDFAKLLRAKLDGSFESFFQERVFSLFYQNGNKVPEQDNDNIPLTAYVGFNDPLSTARDFVDILRQIPLKYTAYMPLNADLSFILEARKNKSVKISDQLSLISASELVAEAIVSHPIEQYNKYLSQDAWYKNVFATVDSTGWYFRYQQSGYISDRHEPRIVSDMTDTIQGFYGALMSAGVLYSSGHKREKPAPFVLVNRNIGDAASIALVLSVAEDTSKCYALHISKDSREKSEATIAIEDIIAPAINMLQGKDSQRLKTSCIWLMRSHLSERDMDQVLASAIAVEVLLGDRETSDRIGLSKLMANRCAYALGNSVEERQEIINLFVQWYKMRSEIVHSGRIRVSADDKRIVRAGKNLASRLLNHEIAMAK